MKLKQIASNMTELHLNDGTIVLFSYETPVAARLFNTNEQNTVLQIKRIKTNKYYSRTTSKHIGKWYGGTAKDIEAVDQSVLDELVK